MRHGWGAVEKDSISISWKEERKKERMNWPPARNKIFKIFSHF